MSNFIVTDISELVTNAPLFLQQKIKNITDSDLGIIENAWLAIQGESVRAFGSGSIPEEMQNWHVFSANNRLVTPGLVDAHTHPIFAGDRSDEFARKLAGQSYQEIAASGGGILATVKATRSASDNELKETLRANLRKFFSWGVTTVEVKTGYGLSVDEEIRLLEIIKDSRKDIKQNLYVTCLALHGLASPHTDHLDYATLCTEKLLPIICERNLADAVDAFIDDGYFQVKDCELFFATAKKLNLDVRVHADEFSNTDASSAGVRWGAKSIDHIQHISDRAIGELARSSTVAILLPGTSLYSKIPFAPANRLLAQNCAVAIASDYNPGSCRISNLPLIATMAALHCNMNTAQTFAGISFVPAYSLGLQQKCGHLYPGAHADFVIHACKNLSSWIADCGQTQPWHVFFHGQH